MVSILRYSKIQGYPVPAGALGMIGNTIIVAWRDNTTAHGGDTSANVKIYRSTDGGRTWTEIATIDEPNLDEMRTGHVMYRNPLTGKLILVSALYDGSTRKGSNVYEIDVDGSYEKKISNLGGNGSYAEPLFEPVEIGGEWYLYCYVYNTSTSPWTWKIVRIRLSDWTVEDVADFTTELNNINSKPNEACAIIDLENNVIYAFIRHDGALAPSTREIHLWRFDFNPSTGAISNPTHISTIASGGAGSSTGCIRIPNTNIAYLIHYEFISTSEIPTYLAKVDLSDGSVISKYDISINGFHGDEGGNGAIILVDPSIETSNGKYVAYAIYENGREGYNDSYDGNFFAAIELDEGGYPKFVLVDITPTSVNVKVGSSFNVSVTIRNDGTGAGTCKVSLINHEGTVQDEKSATLNPGDEYTFTLTGVAPTYVTVVPYRIKWEAV